MSATTAQRDLKMTHADVQRVRSMIHARAGISLAENKEEMVYSRLAKRIRGLGLVSFGDYLDRFERRDDDPEWERFVNALTTNLTSFFRERHHFPVLADHARAKRRPLRIWTCAASTGEEAWSIAMTLAEIDGRSNQNDQILATDIDSDAIVRATAAIYPLADVAGFDSARLRRFFMRGVGAREGTARIHPDLQARVTFRVLNLLDRHWGIEGPFDVIFCRNLMIYFDKPTQRRILDRLAAVLCEDGLLFAGHSENFSGVTNTLVLRKNTVYGRTKSIDSPVMAATA